jgi:hypothetical protein
METVTVQYEGAFTQTLTLCRSEYVKVLDLGRKYGYTFLHTVFIKRDNMERALLELYAIRGMEFKTESPFC